VITQVQAGASVVELCKFGDEIVTRSCAGIYRAKKEGQTIDKGVAFPTCVSVNEVVCHNSPLQSEADQQPALKDGDVVKIDLGVHVDGFVAVVGHTLRVGAAPTVEAPLSDEYANLMQAAHVCSEVATKLIRPGNSNQQLTQAWAKIAENFKVNLVQGIMTHQMKRYVIEGNKKVLLREEVDQKVDDETFEVNEVYGVDIALSTGDGKPKESEMRTTVFKRAVENSYRLKMRASRYLFNEVNAKFPTLPFTLRAFDDEKQARMGVVECQKHELVTPYPVLLEREGSIVVHFKFTVLLLPSGTSRVTGLPFEPAHYTTENTADEDIQAILALSSKKKKKKNKKKKEGEAEAQE
jgi:curved DNA binding protein